MKTLILSALAFVLAPLLTANAQILTVNFDAPGGLGSTNFAGAGADTNGATSEYWNPIAYEGTTSAGLASNGSTSTGITFSDASPYHFDFGTPSPITLFDPFLLNQSGHAVTESLNNVPAGTYNLFIYSQNGGFDSNGGDFTLNGVTQDVVNTAPDHSTFIAGANYTEFTGITLATAGAISFSFGPDARGEGDFNGVQLVQTAGPVATPEPSTWAMMFGGVTALLFVSRLRRKLSL